MAPFWKWAPQAEVQDKTPSDKQVKANPEKRTGQERIHAFPTSLDMMRVSERSLTQKQDFHGRPSGDTNYEPEVWWEVERKQLGDRPRWDENGEARRTGSGTGSKHECRLTSKETTFSPRVESWSDELRKIQQHFCDIPAKNVEPETNHGETLDKTEGQSTK